MISAAIGAPRLPANLAAPRAPRQVLLCHITYSPEGRTEALRGEKPLDSGGDLKQRLVVPVARDQHQPDRQA